jgi:glycosyltransferase involved in cell wall biosynthesis
MRIAFVSTYPPSKGTLNEYGYYLLNHLRQKPDVTEVILLTDQLPHQEVTYEFDAAGCPVDVRPVWRFNNCFNALALLKALRQTRPDVVLFNLQFLSFGDGKIPAALGLLTPWLARLLGIPSVVLLHNILEEVDLQKAGFSRNPILTALYRGIGHVLTQMILRADLVAVTIAKYVDVLEATYKAQNVALVPHGSFELPPVPDFSRRPDPQKVMAFGKFGTYKRVEVLIEAVERVRQRTALNLEIVIAGTDSPNNVGYLAGVQAHYAAVSQLTFTGYVAEEDVARLFSESAVTVFPYSSTTGSSGVLHQAGSYGVAAILPDIGDLAQLVREEGYTGAFFEPDNADSLADALQRVLDDDLYRQHLAKTNFFAATTLPMNDIADWYLLHFETLLNRKMVTQQAD